MRRSVLTLVALLSVGAGSAAAQTNCGRPDEIVPAVKTAAEDLLGANVVGRSAYACARPWSASAIFEKALIARPSILSRFNLASAYAASERFDAAAALYWSVVEDGQFVTLRLDPKLNERTRTSIRVNATDEAQRRLDGLSARLQSNVAPAAIGGGAEDGSSDSIVLSPLHSATLAIISSAHVDEDRALYFDGLAAAPADLKGVTP